MVDFQSLFDKSGLHVSRETIRKLEIYHRLLLKWQKAINLISPTTLEEAPVRHFLDSAQLMRFLPSADIRLADMGSGAGFPGMVLAILGVRDVHLVESDVRKATFLREVSRETNTPVVIHDVRVEACNIPDLDFITARALAPLRDLLAMAAVLATEGRKTTCLFLKGAQAADEIEKAAKKWSFELESFPSMTGEDSKILKINNLTKK